MPTLAARPSTMRSTIPVKSRQNSMVGQQISELQFDKFPNPQSFLVWKIRFKNKVTTLFWFSIKSDVMDQRSGDGWFTGGIEVLAIRFWKEFSKFWDAGREDCICPEQDHPEFLLQEKGQSGGTQCPERGSVSSRKTDCLHDLRLLSSHWCSWHSSWLSWSILYHSSQRWCSGMWYEMGWNSSIKWPISHQMRFWKVCTNWEYVSLINSKPY